MDAAERFARLTATVVASRPWLWPLFRGPFRRMFDALAPSWDGRRSPIRTTAFEAGLAAVPVAPRRALDVGSGTGSATFAIAARWPEAEVVGVDFSERMVEVARAATPPELDGRVRFQAADASRLPFPDASFDLVGLNNMIPFPAELARVTAPGGHLVVAFTIGAGTPIFVPPERLAPELGRHGFEDVRTAETGPGLAVVARRR